MYFVQDSKKTYWENNKEHYNNDFYSVLKVESNQIEDKNAIEYINDVVLGIDKNEEEILETINNLWSLKEL